MKFQINDFGAINDGKTLNTKAIQDAINAASSAGGGKVVIPSGGQYLSGSLLLKPNVDLHLEIGATLLASSEYKDYLPEHTIPAITGGSVVETIFPQRAFISGFKAHGARISGPGTIDGNSDNFILKRGEYIHEMRGPNGAHNQYLERPFTVFLIECNNLTITETLFKDPAFWTIRLTGCDHALVQGIRIHTDLMVPNSDGVDIDRCKDVRILDCEFITADDCISLKSCAETSQYGDVADIVIANCLMTTTSGAITIGTESAGTIRDVVVNNCIVKDSHRGFSVRSREGGTFYNIRFANSIVRTRTFNRVWWGNGEPLHVTAFAWSDKENLGDGNPERVLEGKVRDVTFENITIDSEAGILNWAAHPELIKNITYRNIDLTIGRRSKWEHRIDLRPNSIQDFVEKPHNAIEITNASDVTLENVTVNWTSDSRQEYGVALHSKNAPGLHQNNLIELSRR